MSCDICCDSFNKSTRKQTSCSLCPFSCCLDCQKKYILDLTTDPHCMSCKRGFLREHMAVIFPKSFIEKDYKRHREMILYEREKCMLPATQAEIERDNERRLIYVKRMNHVNRRWVLRNSINKLEYYSKNTKLVARNEITLEEQQRKNEKNKIKIQLMKDEIKAIDLELGNLQTQLNALYYGGETQVREEARKFIKKCPGEDCNGYLSTQWKCGLCNVKVCNKCHEIKTINDNNEEQPHICNEESVKTVELMNKDTKPCPACGTRIFKISGCSQIWCTSCHVAFNWGTLKIETGVIHNPHYYEYQRSINGGVAPRVPGDIPGGGCDEQIPNIMLCMTIWNKAITSVSKGSIRKITDLHRMLNHIRYYEMARLPNNYVANDNKDIRRKFLKNEIDETRFKWFLQKREKYRNKGRELRQLYEMLIACGTDFIRKSIDESTNNSIKEGIDSSLIEFSNLSLYFNESSEKIGIAYNGVIPKIRLNDTDKQWCKLVTEKYKK